MQGFVVNLEKATRENGDFRRVLYTAKHSQLVLMSLKPGEEIGEEVHKLDQFIRLEVGEVKVILDGVEKGLKADEAVIIPQGVRHNVINAGTEEVKLYSIYSPPEHRDGVVHHTKKDAGVDEERFDGKTTEGAD